jgi:hypothetical protein
MNIFRKIPFEFYLILLYLLVVIIINPIGEFPLMDDFSFCKSVWKYSQNGKMDLGTWPAMTLISQIFLGTIFVKIFSLSFLTLRLYTLLIGIIGVIVFYQIAKRIAINYSIAKFATLVLLFNPLYFLLSFSFMTDVHFNSFMLFSIYFFIKYLDSQRTVNILLATLFSIITTLIRQPGILIPFAFTAIFFHKKMDFRNLLYSVLSLAITLLSLIVFLMNKRYLMQGNENIAGLNTLIADITKLSLYEKFKRLNIFILYTGLFILPISALYLKNVARYIYNGKTRVVLFSSIILLVLISAGSYYPAGNIMYNFGLGPKLLKDGYWNVNISPSIDSNIWDQFITTLSICGSILLLLVLLSQRLHFRDFIYNIKKDRNHLKIFLICIASLYLFLLINHTIYYDRHVIPLISLILLILISFNPLSFKFNKVGPISLIVFIAFFSICATHDYLSWNRIRWKAINYLMNEKNVDPTEIDGGFEFNMWYETGHWRFQSSLTEKSYWNVKDDKYVIAFGNISGFEKYKAFYYPQYISVKKDSIYILKNISNTY